MATWPLCRECGRLTYKSHPLTVMTHDTRHWKIATRAKRSKNIHHIYALDNSIKILKYPRWQTIRMDCDHCEDYYNWTLCIVGGELIHIPISTILKTQIGPTKFVILLNQI